MADSFNCSWWDGRKMNVKLSDTWSTSGTEDPVWIVTWCNPDGTPTGQVENFEWLNYVNSNGAQWQAKIHCETSGGGIKLKSCEIKQDGYDGTHDRPGILIRDWDGSGKTIQIDISGRADGSHHTPSFTIYNDIRPGY